MTEEEKYLQRARIALKDVAATRARLEWRTKLADSSALAARVLTQELINHGDLQTLKYVAKYLGTYLPSETQSKQLPSGVFVSTVGNNQTVVIKISKI